MLTVFVQYYVPKNPARAAELNECFKQNIANPLISTLMIFFEVEADMALIPDHEKIVKRFYPQRMTYGYWLRETDKLPVGELSFLINSDMYLTESISHLIANRQAILDDKKFVAISRYNPENGQLVLNKDPHWTQDVWGVAKGKDPFPSALFQEAAFELGQPACDNKIAYVMHSYGFNVTNPCYKVTTVHLQADDNTRSYDPKVSKLIGLQAYIYPSESVAENSALDFDLLTRSKTDITDLRVNNWINNRKSYELKANEQHIEPGAVYVKPAIAGVAGDSSAQAHKETSDQANATEHEGEHLEHAEHEESLSDADAEKFVLRSQFNPKFYREIVRYSDRFAVYDDVDAYYFHDKFWPIVRKIPKSEVKFSDVSKTNFHFFATGFLPASLSLGVVDMSNEMQYDEDVLFWQYPCRTEADAYEAHQLLKGTHIQGHIVDTYVALPWATFVDKESFPDGILGLYGSRIKAAKEIASALGFTVRVHTVCQHVFWRKIQPHFEKIGVTNLWISHKEPGLDQLGDEMYLHAWPLFAVNYLDPKRRTGMQYIPAAQKTIFASFIGAHMEHYLSDVRLKLKQLSDKPGFLVQIKDEWHFNKEVYNFQVYGVFEDADAGTNSATLKYNQTLSNTLFSLCPVGAGPNSLRFWESLAVGSIPVSLSDRFQLPPLDSIDPSKTLRWEDAIIFHPESDIEGLEGRLRSYTPEQLQSFQDKGRAIFEKMRNFVCFGAVERPAPVYEEQIQIDPAELEVMEVFKPQQIHVTGKTQSVFDGICEPVKAEFNLSSEWLEVVIYFDQTERIYGLHFDSVFNSGESLDIEICRFQKYNRFTQLIDAKHLIRPGKHNFTLPLNQTYMAMGIQLRMRVNDASQAKLSVSVEVFKNYFSKQIRQFDQMGYLKRASDTNQERQDITLDTQDIEGGATLEKIPQVVKAEECQAGNLLFPETIPKTTNLIGEPLSDGISMYVHLMNRNENVQANLSNWLTQKFDELVLLDWSSKEPVANIPGVFDDPRVRVVRVEGQEKFIRTLAQNLASQMVRNRLIFKCDSDVLFKGDFFAKHPFQKGEFWVGDWHQGRDFNERHLHGETFYHVDDFYRVNGYDERIMAYGHDDTNLKDRMVLAGMVKKVFSYNQLDHIPHPQELRTSNQDMVHPMVKTYENRIAARTKTIWTSTDQLLTYTRVNPENPTEAQKNNREIIFTANEKRMPVTDTVIEDKAIAEVSAWYASQEALVNMNRDEKIKLIWEKQVE